MEIYQNISPDRSTDNVINANEIIDLEKYYSDDILTWSVPPGDWKIIRYGMTFNGKRNKWASTAYSGGLCYDQIHRNGINAQWNDVVKPFLEVAKNNGNSVKFVFLDSWELDPTNWTHNFIKTFRDLRGYDIKSYMPVLANIIVENREVSNRFLEDFRLTIGELVVKENYEIFKQLAHDNDVLLQAELGGPHPAPVDGLQTLGISDIPMGEFWARSSTHRISEGMRLVLKQGSSAAHIYGKRYFGAEGPTTIGPAWERSPKELKGVLDRAFINGLNRLFWHTYTSSPDEFGIPGIARSSGTHMNRKVTWWEHAGDFIDYINRCQHVLSFGLYQADVLNYYGTGVPRFVFLDSDVKGIPRGYAWDMCNSEVLLTRASVKNGRIYLPDGMNYALLSLSDQESISLPVLRKIEQLVKSGATLVGKPPVRAYGLSDYPESDHEVQAIVKRVWGNINQKSVFSHRYGKGMVYAGKTIGQVLKEKSIEKDFSYVAEDNVELEYIHRFTKDFEIYYVTNNWARVGINDYQYSHSCDLPDRYVNATCSFRVVGEREIVRWDPVTGEITTVMVYNRIGERYNIPVSLAPEGSAFFIFKKGEEKRHVITIKKDGEPLVAGNASPVNSSSPIFIQGSHAEAIASNTTFQFAWSDGTNSFISFKNPLLERKLDQQWKIHFKENPALGKDTRVEVDTLKSWTDFSKREIKYFSGTACYSKNFRISNTEIMQGRVYLDLGNVQDIATIFINGREVTTKWIAPFRTDITDYIRKGENLLEIEVSNMWPNRLIGDNKLPEEERKTNTRVLKFGWPDSEGLLRTSGLLGPVKIIISSIKML